MTPLRKLTGSARSCSGHSATKTAANQIKLCRERAAEIHATDEPKEAGSSRVCMIHPLGGFVSYQTTRPGLRFQHRLRGRGTTRATGLVNPVAHPQVSTRRKCRRLRVTR